ncbi:hypothetical protein BDN72DRAFT_842503 [Pluteus cervinus]|uniref:Uncharacterized protein n=1 Tax=Pluteus cervinus TaxID=181527 RepID=A0ACD3ARG2_9AGAR|nr:hypothetical protein BDN72DRAFT_842503 [Pluteus cervinus]
MPPQPDSADYELLLPGERQDLSIQPMGKEEQYPKPEGRSGDGSAFLAGIVAALVSLILTWVIVLCNSPTYMGWFAFHPLLQSLALTLFTYGILTLQPTSQPKSKVAGFNRHQAAILYVGLPCITLGTGAVIFNKWINNKTHFTTWHGTLGIIAIAWLSIQIALGGGSVWFGGATFGGGAKAKAVWKYHRVSGYVLFPLLMYTAHLGGAWSFWGEKYANAGIRAIAYTVAPLVLVISVFTRIRLTKMKFI